MRTLTVALCGVLMSGCVAKLPAVVSAAKDEPSAQLLFQVEGQPLRVGVVRVRVAGVETFAMIDTGAGRHVVSSTFAQRANLDVAESEDTTHDASGAQLRVQEVFDARIEVEGLGSLPDQPPVVVDLPSVFDDMGIGLIISPQRAVQDGEAISIDYRTGALTRVPDRQKMSSELPSRTRWPEPSRCGGGHIETSGPLYFVDATIDGENVALTLDTGADTTCVFGGAPIASVLRARYVTTAESVLVAGGQIITQRTPAIRVHVGRVTAMRSLPILPREAHGECRQDGHLGLDVLRKCVVVISREHAEVSCPG